MVAATRLASDLGPSPTTRPSLHRALVRPGSAPLFPGRPVASKDVGLTEVAPAVPEPTESFSSPLLPPMRFTLNGNARVDQPFSLVVQAEPAAGITILDVTAPPEALDEARFDAATATLHATPRRVGEMLLTVLYQCNGAPLTELLPESPSGRTAPMTLLVNADPRTLWKNLPSDAAGPDAKPDQASGAWPLPRDEGKGGPGWLMAASQRGRSHAHTGGWRDDDFAVSAGETWQVVAVADGAGSAIRSRRGAEIAVGVARDHAVATLEAAALDELAASYAGVAAPAVASDAATEGSPPSAVTSLAFRALGHAAYQALKAIDAEAQAHGLTRRDYSTTLLLAAHARLPGDAGHLYLAYQIGDGAIGLPTPDAVTLLGTPDAGAYAGQTRFLDAEAIGSTEAIRERLMVHRRATFAPLVVMTDGVSDPRFDSDVALHDPVAWGRLWADIAPVIDAVRAARSGEPLAEWLNFFTPGHHDDRTLVVLV